MTNEADDRRRAIEERLEEIGLLGDAEEMRSVLGEFVESARRRREAATAALEEGDFEAARSAVHALAGTALTLGALRLGRLARRAEDDCAAGRRRSASRLLDLLRTELESIARVCDEICAG